MGARGAVRLHVRLSEAVQSGRARAGSPRQVVFEGLVCTDGGRGVVAQVESCSLGVAGGRLHLAVAEDPSNRRQAFAWGHGPRGEAV